MLRLRAGAWPWRRRRRVPLRADLRGLVPGVLEAKPAWRKDDAAAEGGMENDMNAML